MTGWLEWRATDFRFPLSVSVGLGSASMSDVYGRETKAVSEPAATPEEMNTRGDTPADNAGDGTMGHQGQFVRWIPLVFRRGGAILDLEVEKVMDRRKTKDNKIEYQIKVQLSIWCTGLLVSIAVEEMQGAHMVYSCICAVKLTLS